MEKRVKIVLEIVAVPIIGFILLNLAFLLDALFQGLINLIFGLFIDINPDMTLYWYPPTKHLLFLILIGLISYFVFKSKLKDICKATYLFVPLAAVYVTIGIFLNNIQILVYILSTLFFLATLYYLYKKKLSWIYYYSLILISLLMLIVALTRVEI
jgi:hypothetical protein